MSIATDVGSVKGPVLIVDGGPPDPTASAGLRSRLDLLDALLALGAEVSLHTTESPTSAQAALYQDLRGRGVEGFSSGDGAALAAVVDGGDFGTLIAHGPAWGILSQAAIEAHPELTRVYWGHDIQQRRRAAQARVEGVDHVHGIKALQVIEKRCWAAFDATVYPTEREARIVCEHLGDERGFARPYYWLQEHDLRRTAGFADGAGRETASLTRLLMVGGSAHPPNKDSVEWTITELLPLLLRDEPETLITIVGDWSSDDVRRLSSEHVAFTGQVSDEQLRDLHARSLCLLAPLRFGSGSRRKLVGAMGLGLPVVTTSEGQQGVLVRDGLGLDDGLLIADTASDLARAVRMLREGAELGRHCIAKAHGRVELTYDRSAYLAGVASVLAAADRNRDRRVLSAEGSLPLNLQTVHR